MPVGYTPIGGDTLDYVADRATRLPIAGVAVKVIDPWTDTQITDLLDATGTPCTTLTTDSDGMFSGYAPEVTVAYSIRVTDGAGEVTYGPRLVTGAATGFVAWIEAVQAVAAAALQPSSIGVGTGRVAAGNDLRLRDAFVAGTVPCVHPSDWPYGGLSTAGHTTVTSKSRHLIQCNVADLRFCWHGSYQNETTPLPNTYVVKAAVELADGTILPIYFNGERTVSVPAGKMAVSDPVPIAVTTGTYIWVRTCTTVASTSLLWPISRALQTTEGRVFDVDYADSGTISGGTILSNPPYAIVGTPYAYTGPVVGVVGASTITGQGDTSATGYYHGWLRRYLGNVVPSQFVSNPGDTAQLFTPAYTQGRMQVLRGCTHIIDGYGAGDLLNYGRTLAEFQADSIRGWLALAFRGALVAQSTIQPKTTSTDSWATVGNQASDNAGRETVRVAVNTWLRDGAPINGSTFAAVATGDTSETTVRAGATGHPLTKVIDIAAAIESGLNSGKWKAAHTADGLHPNTTGHTAIAADGDVAAALAAFLAT